ncbi:hypothetical protein PGIGA_G00158240 [Pangasianodon gigas]|uniref:Uncharacterized protein n=1 Tax=Pangasianodon gigas TaxID=30993 RepID=A0ACC5XRY2_PANGG|nr:hypothetical protein [Pangasianodon gigas]
MWCFLSLLLSSVPFFPLSSSTQLHAHMAWPTGQYEWRKQDSNGPRLSSLGCEVAGISETPLQLCRR